MNASLNRIFTVAGKEWIQILRDKRSLILSLMAPILILLLFGYALTMDVKHIGFTVADNDRSAASRSLIEKFIHTEYFEFIEVSENTADTDRLFNSRRINMAIVIPSGFNRNIDRGRNAPIQILVDGSDSTSANVALGYALTIIQTFAAETSLKNSIKKGTAPQITGIKTVPRYWYNENMESKNFILPGLTAIILSIICALIASLAISREHERGTLESILSTPVRPHEFIAGKMIPYILIGIFDTINAFTLGYFVFNLPIKGLFIELLLITVLFTGGMCALGILISTAAKTQVLSVQMAMIATYLPAFILSGFAFPIANMPAVIQVITHVIPARYLITVTKGIALKGAGASLLSTQIIFLSLFFIIVTFLAVRKFSSLIPYRSSR